jgi:hypothetical protein
MSSQNTNEFFAGSVRKWRCGSNSERHFLTIWSLSCSGRVSIYALNIRCANKVAHCEYEKLVWSALPNCKQIAYSFCWRVRKRKCVSQWQMARSKWKWTSIATVPDLCSTTVKILTHLISRYQLPLKTTWTFFFPSFVKALIFESMYNFNFFIPSACKFLFLLKDSPMLQCRSSLNSQVNSQVNLSFVLSLHGIEILLKESYAFSFFAVFG